MLARCCYYMFLVVSKRYEVQSLLLNSLLLNTLFLYYVIFVKFCEMPKEQIKI